MSKPEGCGQKTRSIFPLGSILSMPLALMVVFLWVNWDQLFKKPPWTTRTYLPPAHTWKPPTDEREQFWEWLSKKDPDR